MQYWLRQLQRELPHGPGLEPGPRPWNFLLEEQHQRRVGPQTNRSPTWPTGGSPEPPLDRGQRRDVRRHDGAHRTGDNAVAASTAWTIAEFNIFGYGGDNSGGGGTASFNAGASVDTRTEIIYGGNTAPNCVARGFTAEKNNLSFGPTAPARRGPGRRSSSRRALPAAPCRPAPPRPPSADTHLRTFNGLFLRLPGVGGLCSGASGSGLRRSSAGRRRERRSGERGR